VSATPAVAASEEQHCPACGATVLRTAREGGLLLRSRFVRIVPGTSRHDPARVLVGCPGCRGELEMQRAGLPLLFRHGPHG
jgi:hypothetical protein